MAYKAKTIDFNGILEDITSRTNFLDDPKRLLRIIREDLKATSEILSKVGVNLERVIEDLYFKEEVPLKEEVEEEEGTISKDLLKEVEVVVEEEVEEEMGAILSIEEITYLRKVFDRHVLTVAGVSEKEVSMITEALSDEEYLTKKGIPKKLADRLGPLLISPVLKAVNKLSKEDVDRIRRLLAKRGPAKEEKPIEEPPKEKAPEEKPKDVPKKKGELFAEFIDYGAFIDTVIEREDLSPSILIETIGRDSEVVYDVMTRLLHISPEKVGKDLLRLRSKDEIERYIDDALLQLKEDAIDGLLEILKPHPSMIYGLLKRLGIGLQEALSSFYKKDRARYNSFVDILFLLYEPMLKSESLKELVFKDNVIGSSLIKECGLEEKELEGIIRAHDEIGVEIERLFKSYKQDYEPFKGIKYGEIDEATERLKEGVEEELRSNEAKVEFLYGIYDAGLNYELEGKKYEFCEAIFRYCGRAAANPYEICLRLGDKLDIPLPKNFLRDMALSLAMSLKRTGLISEERFNELLERANEYRQKEGYYEISREHKMISLEL